MPLTLADFLADAAAVFIETANGGTLGSGRLIAPGLVLTAGHVVDYPKRKTPLREGWKVRLLRERAKDRSWTAEPHDATLLWRGQGDLDLALIQISNDVKPSLKPVIASYDKLGSIDDVDAAGFPEARYTETGNLRDYTVRGILRLPQEHGTYAWNVPSADKPDDPRKWKGMSGAGVCFLGTNDKLYLFGAVQQVPANFSAGGMLEVARVSDGVADTGFFSHLQTALGEKPSVVSWEKDSRYGFSNPELTELAEKMKSNTVPEAWIDRQEKLAARSAVSEAALLNIARRLGIENVSTEELGPALMDRIDRLQAAQSQIRALPASDPMKSIAEVAANAGDYVRAENLFAIAQDQTRAVKYIEDGNPDLAIALLDNAARQLGDISKESSADDRIVQGYIYKTLWQAYSAKGDEALADESLNKALAVFRGLRQETTPEGKSVRRFAEVMNGMGNMLAARGQYSEAIGNYRAATSLMPTYAYAWHDMFLAYYALAEQGDVHLDAMRQALAKTKQTGIGWPQMGPDRFARLDSMIARFEQKNTGRRPPKNTSAKQATSKSNRAGAGTTARRKPRPSQ
jgi:tetratricopeptide (TPR) repeat protein